MTVPLARFVDWNSKIKGCDVPIKGINEDIGNGALDLHKKENFQFQVVVFADDWGNKAEISVGSIAKFVRIEK